MGGEWHLQKASCIVVRDAPGPVDGRLQGALNGGHARIHLHALHGYT